MSDYESLRARHSELLHRLRPEYLARLRWNTEMLQEHRTRELRRVLGIAKALAPAYRQRLANIDPMTATEADLTSIQPLTKCELMSNFDDFLTDRRLSRDLVEAHLAELSDDAYLLDEFHVAESSGSSGRRGVFVYAWDAWPVYFLTLVRFRLRFQRAHPQIGLTRRRATVAAGNAPYMTYVLPRTFLGLANTTPIPATLPLPQIVDRLNALQPTVLDGYASMLSLLAREALAGRLRITPRVLGPNSEPLLPEMRQAMEEAWHCPILNTYATSEGVAAA
jgi:phenylacetate-CoA ligase